MSDTMVERVARVISTEMYGGYPVGETSDRAINAQWERTKKIASLVIEALREPTEAMVEASAAIYGDDWRNRHEYSKDQWRAMVDAALKEQEGEKG